MKKELLLVAAIGLLAGCTTMRAGEYNGRLNVVAETTLKPDIGVTDKISGSASEILLFGFIPLFGPDKFADGVAYGYVGNSLLNADPYGSVKSGAAYNAIKSSGSDLIVAPRYNIESTNYFLFKKVNATVSGFKGIVYGFKN